VINSGPFNIDFVNFTLVLFGQDITPYLAIGGVLYISSTDVPTNNGSKTIASFSTNGSDTTIVFTTTFTTNTNGSGSINVIGKQGLGPLFPLIDYGTYSADKINWDYQTFRPALHVYEYIKKIFEGIGYKYVAPLFELSFFKTLIIPLNQKVLTGNKQNIFKGGKTALTLVTIPGSSTAVNGMKM